jgi:hypothetical protein
MKINFKNPDVSLEKVARHMEAKALHLGVLSLPGAAYGDDSHPLPSITDALRSREAQYGQHDTSQINTKTSKLSVSGRNPEAMTTGCRENSRTNTSYGSHKRTKQVLHSGFQKFWPTKSKSWNCC